MNRTMPHYPSDIVLGIAEYIELKHNILEYWKAHKQALRTKSIMKVSFIVKFHPDSGEIVSVIQNCDLPCQCEECAFREICNNIKSRIISTNKDKCIKLNKNEPNKNIKI